MVIGLLTVDLQIDSCDSLKDKRQVLKSMLAHLRQEFNISVSETGEHDIWRRAQIAAAVVATDASFADKVLAGVLRHIESDPRVVVGGVETQLL